MKTSLLSLALALGAATAFAAAAPPHPPIMATRLQGSIGVDGELNESIWQSAPPVTAFHQMEPDQGQPASQKSEVRIAYDDAAIYVGARLWDTAPDSIIARLSRRDESVPSDRFSCYLDPYHDRRSGYYFLVNAAGTMFDGTLSNDGNEDSSWDGVWDAKVRRHDQGWTVEMRIPYSQLRFRPESSMTWGVNFRRVIVRRAEESFLAYQPRDESGFVSRWPDLIGLDGVRPPRSIELLPYFTAKGEYLRHDPLDPFNDGSAQTPDGGFDLRTGIGSRLTLNASINPDFGQVEVDPAVVNLSDVESFFQEKRPFFVEGQSNFRFGNEGANSYWNFNWPEPLFFYSRRVGRTPQGDWPSTAAYGDVPLGTTILGATKLTGKITPTTNFGTLHAITARERGDFLGPGGDFRQDMEPLTYYGVVRGLREFKDRRQGLGLLSTYVRRSFQDGLLETQLNESAFTGGVDGWFFLDKDKVWVVSGYSTLTHVTGTAQRITALQQGSRHYYQRPDAGHVEVDPSATSLTGSATRLWLNKEKGAWFSNSAIGFITPGFEQNDIGFQSYSDLVNGHSVIGRRWSEPGKVKRFAQTTFAAFSNFDFGGHRTVTGIFNGGFVEFQNRMLFNWWNSYTPPATDVRRTRGGPRMERPFSYDQGFWISTNQLKKLVAEFSMSRWANDRGSLDLSFNPAIEWKPVSNVRLNLGPGYYYGVDGAQYVATLDNPAATATYGKDYVFARLRQTTVSANIRVSWALRPTMSLQAFIQPFIATGDYTGFKALAAPNTYDFVPVAEPYNPDFNFKSLRGNAVFRWEYLPGSAFFLVWTQERTDNENVGDFSFGPDTQRLFDAQANNILLAKVSYYFNL